MLIPVRCAVKYATNIEKERAPYGNLLCILSGLSYGDKKQSIFNLRLIKNTAAQAQFKSNRERDRTGQRERNRRRERDREAAHEANVNNVWGGRGGVES